MIQIGDLVWLGTEDGHITKVRTENFEHEGSWLATSVTISSFAKLNTFVWSGADNGTLSMWDVNPETTNPSHTSTSNVQLNTINCISVIGDQLWTCSSDHSIIVWDLDKLTPIAEFIEHENAVFNLTKVDNDTVWSCSSDGTISMWKLHPPAEKHKSRSRSCLSYSHSNENRNEEISTSRIASMNLLSPTTEPKSSSWRMKKFW